MISLRQILITLLGLASTGTAFACADPPRAKFRDIVSEAPTVFTFELTSAFHVRKLKGGIDTSFVVGHIRVVDSLKGNAGSFRLIRYTPTRCGSTRMSVGQYYVAATSQTGSMLDLWSTDQAILDLTLDFYEETNKQSRAVDIVKAIIGGAPVPKDFPRKSLESPMDVYPLPPPASQQKAP